MLVKNSVIHKGISFEDYAKLPGISHSDIRNEGREPFVPTKKMNLGTDVHNYLLTPEVYHHENITVVKPIALALKSAIGGLWEHLEHELAVTAEFHEQGFVFPFRGRIDSGIRKKVVIDYKIINGNSVRDTMQFFHYDTQTSGYGLGIEAPASFIIAYSTKTKKVEIVYQPVITDWWSIQVITRGKPIV